MSPYINLAWGVGGVGGGGEGNFMHMMYQQHVLLCV